MTDWGSMETAPRDGKQILLFTSGGDFVVGEWRRFRDGTAIWQIGHTQTGIIALPAIATHWMLLPQPPKKERSR